MLPRNYRLKMYFILCLFEAEGFFFSFCYETILCGGLLLTRFSMFYVTRLSEIRHMILEKYLSIKIQSLKKKIKKQTKQKTKQLKQPHRMSHLEQFTNLNQKRIRNCSEKEQ